MHLPSLTHFAMGLLAVTAAAADPRCPPDADIDGVAPCRPSRRQRARRMRSGAAGRRAAAAPQPACPPDATHPKVALMFLSRGAMPQEEAWRAWFKGAANRMPKRGSDATACPAAPAALTKAPTCAPPNVATGGDAIAAQDLFSVYVHAAPDYVFDATSLFASRRIDARVAASWGQHALIDAERALVRAGLEDSRNVYFVLLSESGVPLYPADTVYSQLVREETSRVNACFHEGSNPWRWHPAMGRDDPALPRDGWRKSPQWITLTRKHAQVFSDDTALDAVFRRHCEHRQFDAELQQGFHCYSDEHYIPVLLSHMQLGHETDCVGGSVSADWSAGGPSPRTYNAGDVDASLFVRLRRDDCAAQLAVDTAPAMFAANATLAACETPPAWDTAWLHAKCPLFARKFSPEAAEAIMHVMTDCDNGLQLARC